MSAGLPLAAEDIAVAFRQSDGTRATIVEVADFTLAAGAQVAVTGPSGAGKTSLVHVLAGIARPDRGRVRWGGTDIAALGEGARDSWRRRHVGLIFQDFHLIPELCVLGNVLMPVRFASWRTSRAMRERAEALLVGLGLTDLRRRTALLSRGEQQRAAVARALLLDPAVILADEPTASLDGENAASIADLLVETARGSGATLVVATHDPGLIARLGEARAMRNGRFAPVPGAPVPGALP